MDGWTRSCASIHVFSLSCTLQNVLQKVWTGGQALKILIILMTKIMYFIIQKCGYVDKKLSFYFISSFYLLPFKFLAKSVDRWTSSEKKSAPCMALLDSTDMWTRSCLSISCFLSCTIYNIWKKCGQMDKSSEYSEKRACTSLCGNVDKKLFFYFMRICF